MVVVKPRAYNQNLMSVVMICEVYLNKRLYTFGRVLESIVGSLPILLF